MRIYFSHTPVRHLNMKYPELTTERLLLRSTSEADIDAIYSIFSDPDVTRYYDIDPITSLEQASQIIESYSQLYASGSGVRWGIVRREDFQLIGTCGYFGRNRDFKSASIGYDLAKTQWGMGIMQEALSSILEFGFQEFSLNRIQATTDLDSSRSISKLRRLGFQGEGILRQYGYWKGKFHDVRCFSLLQSDQAAGVYRAS